MSSSEERDESNVAALEAGSGSKMNVLSPTQLTLAVRTLQRWLLAVMRNEGAILTTLGAEAVVFESISGTEHIGKRMRLCATLGTLIDEHVRLMEAGKGCGVAFDDKGIIDTLREISDEDKQKEEALGLAQKTRLNAGAKTASATKRPAISSGDDDDEEAAAGGAVGGAGGRGVTPAGGRALGDGPISRISAIDTPKTVTKETVATKHKRQLQTASKKARLQKESEEGLKEKVSCGDMYGYKNNCVHIWNEIKAFLIESEGGKGGWIVMLDEEKLTLPDTVVQKAMTAANGVDTVEWKAFDTTVMAECMSRFIGSVLQAFVNKSKARPIVFHGTWDGKMEGGTVQEFCSKQSNLLSNLLFSAADHCCLDDMEKDLHVEAMQLCVDRVQNVCRLYKCTPQQLDARHKAMAGRTKQDKNQ